MQGLQATPLFAVWMDGKTQDWDDGRLPALWPRRHDPCGAPSVVDSVLAPRRGVQAFAARVPLVSSYAS